jgi:hypothetical protein
MQAPTPEIDGKMRQYKRVLLSYADFKHAKLASAYILDCELHANYPKSSYVIREALNCSMIVVYCRPFSGNGGSVPDLPSRLLRVLTPDEERFMMLSCKTATRYWRIQMMTRCKSNRSFGMLQAPVDSN